MQVGRTRLTPEERQHRFNQQLCLYCGQPGHLISTCPVLPKGPAPLCPRFITIWPRCSARSERCLCHPTALTTAPLTCSLVLLFPQVGSTMCLAPNGSQWKTTSIRHELLG